MSDSPATGGLLLLDKPVGITSNAALGRAKRIVGIRKAGHTGTLDPMASGLLVLCFGQATKVAAFLLDADKTYEAEVRLGVVTDSADAEGEVVERRRVPQFDCERIESVLERFRGPIEQVPPMHSALKHEGRRLYELARRGEHVERPPRAVVIHELELIAHEADTLRLTVTCSKGTYIRALARDLGEALQCGAHLGALRRTRSAPFNIEDAIGLDVLESLDRDEARRRLVAADRALEDLPEIHLDDSSTLRIRQGQRLAGLSEPHRGRVRVYGPAGFIGIGEMDGAGRLRPVRLFVAD